MTIIIIIMIMIMIINVAANPRTNIVDFRGSDSSIILSLRGGILMSIGDFPEESRQAILVEIMLVGRLGVEFQNCVFWLRTNGVNTDGAATKVTNLDRLGKKVRPGTFGKVKVG